MSVPGWEIGVGIEPNGGAGNGAADDPCLGICAAPDVSAGVATVGVAPFASVTSGEAVDDPSMMIGAGNNPCLGTGAAPDVGAGVATVGVAPFARLTSGEAADDPTPKGLSPTGIGKPTTVLVAVSITDTVLSVKARGGSAKEDKLSMTVTAPLSVAGGGGRDEGRLGKISTACGASNKGLWAGEAMRSACAAPHFNGTWRSRRATIDTL
jgi:hypothetical protein